MASLTLEAFARHWAGSTLSERSSYPTDISDEDILKNLLALNLERSGREDN